MKAYLLAACCTAMLGAPHLAVAETADTAAGAEIYAASCAACHGRAGRGVSAYPSLQNRTADYITEKLEIYRSGERIGPNSALMIPNARDLTDTEIAALSVFIAETFR
jgi:cytochrome c553